MIRGLTRRSKEISLCIHTKEIFVDRTVLLQLVFTRYRRSSGNSNKSAASYSACDATETFCFGPRFVIRISSAIGAARGTAY